MADLTDRQLDRIVDMVLGEMSSVDKYGLDTALKDAGMIAATVANRRDALGRDAYTIATDKNAYNAQRPAPGTEKYRERVKEVVKGQLLGTEPRATRALAYSTPERAKSLQKELPNASMFPAGTVGAHNYVELMPTGGKLGLNVGKERNVIADLSKLPSVIPDNYDPAAMKEMTQREMAEYKPAAGSQNTRVAGVSETEIPSAIREGKIQPRATTVNERIAQLEQVANEPLDVPSLMMRPNDPVEMVRGFQKSYNEPYTQPEMVGFYTPNNGFVRDVTPSEKIFDKEGNLMTDNALLSAVMSGSKNYMGLNPDMKVNSYGPSAFTRHSGSTNNHGQVSPLGIEVKDSRAVDVVLTDRNTGNFLTNHIGPNHQYQGSWKDAAPNYQDWFNQVALDYLAQDPSAMPKDIAWGGYHSKADTMHVDTTPTRGARGATMGGFNDKFKDNPYLGGGLAEALLNDFAVPNFSPDQKLDAENFAKSISLSEKQIPNKENFAFINSMTKSATPGSPTQTERKSQDLYGRGPLSFKASPNMGSLFEQLQGARINTPEISYNPQSPNLTDEAGARQVAQYQPASGKRPGSMQLPEVAYNPQSPRMPGFSRYPDIQYNTELPTLPARQVSLTEIQKNPAAMRELLQRNAAQYKPAAGATTPPAPVGIAALPQKTGYVTMGERLAALKDPRAEAYKNMPPSYTPAKPSIGDPRQLGGLRMPSQTPQLGPGIRSLPAPSYLKTDAVPGIRPGVPSGMPPSTRPQANPSTLGGLRMPSQTPQFGKQAVSIPAMGDQKNNMYQLGRITDDFRAPPPGGRVTTQQLAAAKDPSFIPGGSPKASQLGRAYGQYEFYRSQTPAAVAPNKSSPIVGNPSQLGGLRMPSAIPSRAAPSVVGNPSQLGGLRMPDRIPSRQPTAVAPNQFAPSGKVPTPTPAPRDVPVPSRPNRAQPTPPAAIGAPKGYVPNTKSPEYGKMPDDTGTKWGQVIKDQLGHIARNPVGAIGKMALGMLAGGPGGSLGLLGGIGGLFGGRGDMPQGMPTFSGGIVDYGGALAGAKAGNNMVIGRDASGNIGWGGVGGLSAGAAGAGWASNNPERNYGGYGGGYDPTPT